MFAHIAEVVQLGAAGRSSLASTGCCDMVDPGGNDGTQRAGRPRRAAAEFRSFHSCICSGSHGVKRPLHMRIYRMTFSPSRLFFPCFVHSLLSISIYLGCHNRHTDYDGLECDNSSAHLRPTSVCPPHVSVNDERSCTVCDFYAIQKRIHKKALCFVVFS